MGQIEQAVQAVAVKRRSFGGTLHFDKPACVGHDDVHVYRGLRVFFIGQIEALFAFDDADGDGCDPFGNRDRLHMAFGLHPGQRFDQRHECAGNGGGAGSAVGLQNVTIQRNRALAQCIHFDDGAERTAYQTLNFDSPSTRFLSVARRPGVGGTRQHGILSSHPSCPFALEERRDFVFDTGSAEHLSLPNFDKAGAFSVAGIAAGQCNRAVFAEGTAIVSGHKRTSLEVMWEQYTRPAALLRSFFTARGPS